MNSTPLFALERWAQARPAQRFPMLLLALLLLVGLAGGITGCGGSGSNLVAAGSGSTQAGSSEVGAALLVLPLQGPDIVLDAPATVRVRIRVRLQQQAHYAAGAQVSVAMRQPWPTGPSITPVTLSDAAPLSIGLDYGVTMSLSAGRTPLVAQIAVQATDPATGLSTAALGHAEAEADWVVDR